MADEMIRPPRCQSAAGGCLVPPSVLITYETAPTTGRLAAPGATFMMAFCGTHLQAGVSEVYKSGGRVVSEDDLPPLPSPIEPEPIGLDAIDPTVREV